ncbi:MAG TPA: hypothetical protein VF836_04810 [Gemmatimonadaceae bacterium]
MRPTSFLNACSIALAALAIPPGLGAQVVGKYPVARSEATRDSTVRDPHAVQPERPTVATHAGTVARGFLELEEGGEWDKAPDGARTFLAPTNLKIGLASRAQLNLLVNVISDRALRGGFLAAGDFTVGVKYRIVDDDPILGDFAILPAVKLPTASQSAAGTGTTDFSLLLISSHQLGPVAMDLNVGQTWRGGDGTSTPKRAGIWTASFGFPVSGPLGATVELFGYPRTTGPVGAKGIAALLIGPTYLVREWFALDAGIIAPLTGPQPKAIYTGFVWNFGCIVPGRLCVTGR